MAVEANKASLLVNIWHQIVPLNAIRPGDMVLGRSRGVRCAILPIVVVLVSAIEIAPHSVTIMAAQALLICRCCKAVATHCAIFEGKVTGRAARTVGDLGVVISPGINMTTQASATERIISKRRCSVDGVDAVGVWYIGGRGQRR